jgi:hypothetical protein
LLLERLADERKKHAGLLESLQKWKMESGQKTTELEKVRRESQGKQMHWILINPPPLYPPNPFICHQFCSGIVERTVH